MLVWEDSRFPQDVQDLARRVDRWRRKRVGRARMPENLWAEALEVASEWGPYQAAQVLGLCDSTVKWSLEAQGPLPADITEASAAPAFIEILNPMKAGQMAGCVLEVQIHTCGLNQVNPFDYLTELQRHAAELRANPAGWMPWNYQERLARPAPG